MPLLAQVRHNRRTRTEKHPRCLANSVCPRGFRKFHFVSTMTMKSWVLCVTMYACISVCLNRVYDRKSMRVPVYAYSRKNVHIIYGYVRVRANLHTRTRTETHIPISWHQYRQECVCVRTDMSTLIHIVFNASTCAHVMSTLCASCPKQCINSICVPLHAPAYVCTYMVNSLCVCVCDYVYVCVLVCLCVFVRVQSQSIQTVTDTTLGPHQATS